MKSLSQSVLAVIKRKREGSVITAESLSEQGSRSAIDQTLSRLAAKGEIMRISRGAYVVPRKSEFGSFPPSAERVVTSMSKRTSRSGRRSCRTNLQARPSAQWLTLGRSRLGKRRDSFESDSNLPNG